MARVSWPSLASLNPQACRLPERRFPPPWSVEETDACFIVRDANVQALAYVYFEDELGRRAARNSSRATTRGASPPTSRSCRSCCGPADKRGVTRLQPHISRRPHNVGLDPKSGSIAATQYPSSSAMAL